MFSSMQISPLPIARSKESKYPFWSVLNETNFSPSILRNHLIPCSCGSTIKGQRSLFRRIVAFSVDIRSEGNALLFHRAMSAASVNIETGSFASVNEIEPFSDLIFDMNGTHDFCINSTRYCFVKYPK